METTIVLFAGALSALAVFADLAPDESGTCTQLSVSMPIVALPAFLFTDDA